MRNEYTSLTKEELINIILELEKKLEEYEGFYYEDYEDSILYIEEKEEF